MGRVSYRRLLVLSAILVAVVALATPASAATAWLVRLAVGSSGQAKAQAIPAAPAGLTASCPAPTTSKTVKLVWTAVTHATSYTVYQSTTSATAGFTSVATGVATATWTSGTLAAAIYWYKVTVTMGSNWVSAQSTATSQATIHATSLFCTQP